MSEFFSTFRPTTASRLHACGKALVDFLGFDVNTGAQAQLNPGEMARSSSLP